MSNDYKTIGSDLGALIEEKQAAYGDVFSATPAIIGLLFPNGIPVAGYKDVLTIVRILDKIGRICTAAGKGDPMGEDPWRDIAGYAMLMLGKRVEKDELVDKTDGPLYNAGRCEGRADVCAGLRKILDPTDAHHWNKDGLLGEVDRLKREVIE